MAFQQVGGRDVLDGGLDLLQRFGDVAQLDPGHFVQPARQSIARHRLSLLHHLPQRPGQVADAPLRLGDLPVVEPDLAQLGVVELPRLFGQFPRGERGIEILLGQSPHLRAGGNARRADALDRLADGQRLLADVFQVRQELLEPRRVVAADEFDQE